MKNFVKEYRDYLLFMGGAVFWGLGEGMYIYYQTIYMEQLGAQPVLIGACFSIIGVVQMVIQTPAGYLTDRYGRRPMLWAGWLIAVSSVWIYYFAQSITVFLIGLFVNGLMAVGWPAQYSYIATATHKMSPSRSLTLMMSFTFIGNVLGTLISSQVSADSGIRIVYLLAAISVTVSALFVLSLRPQVVEKHPIVSKDQGILRNGRLMIFMAILLVVSMGTTLPYILASNFLQNQVGLNLREIGSLGVIAGIGNVVVLLFVGNLNPILAFLIGQALLGAFSGILWLGQGTVLYRLAYFCLGGIWLTKMIAVALVKQMARAEDMGLAIGMAETLKALAMILAPFLAGLLYQVSPEKPFSFGFGVVAAGFILTLAFYSLQTKSILFNQRTNSPS